MALEMLTKTQPLKTLMKMASFRRFFLDFGGWRS